MSARAVAHGAAWLLFGLLLAWHLALQPPLQMPRWLAALLHAAPLLPALVLFLRGARAAPFWAAVAALVLFSHGVTEAWSEPGVRALAAAEVALSVVLVVAASWDGLRARLARRRAA
jgi:uncharacterized membrane protein